MVDAVADRLAEGDGYAGNHRRLFAQFRHHCAEPPPLQIQADLDFTGIGELAMFILLAPSGAARGLFYRRMGKHQLFYPGGDLRRLFQRGAGAGDDHDRQRPFVKGGKKRTSCQKQQSQSQRKGECRPGHDPARMLEHLFQQRPVTGQQHCMVRLSPCSAR